MQCIARFQSVNPVTILMVADDGTFSGTSEAVYLINALKGTIKAPANTTLCQQLLTGTLLGEQVVIAISGDHHLSLQSIETQYITAVWQRSRSSANSVCQLVVVWIACHMLIMCPKEKVCECRHWTRSIRSVHDLHHRMCPACQGLHISWNKWMECSKGGSIECSQLLWRCQRSNDTHK